MGGDNSDKTITIMKINEFISKIEVEFEELESNSHRPETNFRDMEDWSSMHALIIIALIDTDYDVTITGEDLSQIETISELFEIVKSRIN
jgi:acyl carrier protein